MIQKLQQDFFNLQIEAYDLMQNGLMLVWIICLVVFFISWFASGSPSWMALVGFIAAFVISIELKQCRPVPPSVAGVNQTPASSTKPRPRMTPNPSPRPSISPSPVVPSPSPTNWALPPVPPILSPTPPPPQTPPPHTPPPISPPPTPPQQVSPALRNLPVAVIVGTASTRFEAVLIKKEGNNWKVRLFDTKSDDWLDEEIHVLKQEPQVGAFLLLDGVSAKYVGARKGKK